MLHKWITDLCKLPGDRQLSNLNLSATYHNPIIVNHSFAFTTYKVSDDINDLAQAGSFFLLPDPDNKIGVSQENCILNLISEHEEMMLYDQPINSNHNLYKN
jgi:hypothetical protein